MSRSSPIRICKHLLMTPWHLRRCFPAATLEAIELEIKTNEAGHAGEICFVVEDALHGAALYRGQSPRDRAIEVFSRLHLWDTHHRNAVLIYVLLADRAVEIVADRGAHSKVGPDAWRDVCGAMESAFRIGKYRRGTVVGVRMVARHLSEHFPAQGAVPESPLQIA
jgi:uncharacterized membrane protein